jgi:hypothetical protein
MNRMRGLYFACLLPALWLVGAGTALIDACQLGVIFQEDRLGISLLSGCVLSGIVLGGVLLWTWRIRSLGTDRDIVKHCCVMFLIVVVLKIGWCRWLNDTQPNDMERYWRYGQLLARGDYHDLQSAWKVTPGIFVRRAFYYTAPIFRFLGSEQWHLEIVNVSLQMGTLWILFLWGRSAIGLRATATALPWYVLYPDWWFAPTLASHEIPAMLLVSCVLWASESFRRHLPQQAREPGVLGRLLSYTVFAGVCSAYLNVIRDFGPIMLLTAAVGVGMYFWGYGNFSGLWSNGVSLRSRESILLQCFVVFCLVYTGTNLALFRLQEIPEFQERSSFPISGFLPSVATDSDATFPTLAPWLLQYTRAIPADEKNALLVRKSLWEKLGKGMEFWAHVYRKKQVLASAGRTMEYAFCGDQGSFTRPWDLPRYAFGRIYCGVVYGLLSLLVLLRLLRVEQLPMGGGEHLAFVFGLGLLTPLLLITESQPTYDQLLIIPMGAAVGVLACSSEMSRNSVRFGTGKYKVLTGACCLAAAVSLQAALGGVVNRLGMTFATIDRVKCHVGEFSVRPERLTLNLSQPKSDAIGVAELADVEFSLLGKSLEDGVLKFFLSSDHQNQMLMNDLPWGDCPWTWDLIIDGRVVLSGFVRDLGTPVLKELRLPEQGHSVVNCRLVVRGDRSWSIKEEGIENYVRFPEERIALEYCY